MYMFNGNASPYIDNVCLIEGVHYVQCPLIEFALYLV